MKFWQNWTYVVYNRHTEFQADIFIPARLITKRIEKVLFSKFTKSAYRSHTQSLCLCSQLLTIHLPLGMRIHVCPWLVPGVSSMSLQQLLYPVSHRVDETDDPCLWNSVATSSPGGVKRYSREKDHQPLQLYEEPGATTAGEKWRILHGLIRSIQVSASSNVSEQWVTDCSDTHFG